MLDILLFEPEIPPNTGNIIRLCANTGARLRRAGLDCHETASLQRHADLASCLEALGQPRLFAFTTRGARRFDSPAYRAGDAFLFGPESRGLPTESLETVPPEQRLRLPMRAGQRSLNLSNAVAVAVFEAWRQLGYPGEAGPGGEAG